MNKKIISYFLKSSFLFMVSVSAKSFALAPPVLVNSSDDFFHLIDHSRPLTRDHINELIQSVSLLHSLPNDELKTWWYKHFNWSGERAFQTDEETQGRIDHPLQRTLVRLHRVARQFWLRLIFDVDESIVRASLEKSPAHIAEGILLELRKERLYQKERHTPRDIIHLIFGSTLDPFYVSKPSGHVDQYSLKSLLNILKARGLFEKFTDNDWAELFYLSLFYWGGDLENKMNIPSKAYRVLFDWFLDYQGFSSQDGQNHQGVEALLGAWAVRFGNLAEGVIAGSDHVFFASSEWTCFQRRLVVERQFRVWIEFLVHSLQKDLLLTSLGQSLLVPLALWDVLNDDVFSPDLKEESPLFSQGFQEGRVFFRMPGLQHVSFSHWGLEFPNMAAYLSVRRLAVQKMSPTPTFIPLIRHNMDLSNYRPWWEVLQEKIARPFWDSKACNLWVPSDEDHVLLTLVLAGADLRTLAHPISAPVFNRIKSLYWIKRLAKLSSERRLFNRLPQELIGNILTFEPPQQPSMLLCQKLFEKRSQEARVHLMSRLTDLGLEAWLNSLENPFTLLARSLEPSTSSSRSQAYPTAPVLTTTTTTTTATVGATMSTTTMTSSSPVTVSVTGTQQVEGGFHHEKLEEEAVIYPPVD